MITCIRVLADVAQIKRCCEKVERMSPEFSRTASVLNLTGNEIRLKMLYLLRLEHELCPCDLSDILGMTVPAISQHLRKLKDAGLVTSRKKGQTVLYSISADRMSILMSLFELLNEPQMLLAI